ncbi:MAG: hypothetical protein JSS72_01140 [Armatimonadetes bacterium]|nr:hypothetical protein [Armatimonadota bacterium]
MYLISVYENGGFVEASLGGVVTPDEMKVFGMELQRHIEESGLERFNLLLDHAKSSYDETSFDELCGMKDKLYGCGAYQIIDVVSSVEDKERHTKARLQKVLEGFEDYVMDPSEAHFMPLAAIARAA